MERDTIGTRRMRLRPFGRRDLGDLLALGGEARVVRHLLDNPLSGVADAAAFVLWDERMRSEHPGFGFWHASDRAGGFLGMFSLVPEADRDEVGIGARLLPRAWGRGYALEGGAALCGHGFATLGLRRIEGLCAPQNRSVPQLLERLGFTAAGESSQFGRPALRFLLAREDWRGVRGRRRAMSSIGD
ncbi:GNAT family N-acetyltransferase [Coralloluteibacterium stylophorae]|uniref:GNAT family N-acetyltransferase n=1 Tax=Coralloluteibacterium stylophorae TaxID=1776034 RepID=A0A8J8AYF5_9GAMM